MAGTSLVPTLPLFREEAARALRIFKRLKLPDVIGTPTMGEACGPWFFPIVEAIFGSYDPSNNERMISEFFELIPKGNSKSSSGGALMVVALIVNRRPEAEFLNIAPTMNVANIAFKQAKGTIRADAELAKKFHIQDHLRQITHRVTGATLQIKAADTDVIGGSKATGTMIDEASLFAMRAKAEDLYIELRGALGKRKDGFLIQTTTQSKVPPSGTFKAELQRARDVRDGKIQMPLLPILYEFPEVMQKDGSWKARAFWHLVNPNLGRSLGEDFIARELPDAEKVPEKLILFASQHFNIQIGIGLRSGAWPGAEFWERRGDSKLTLEDVLERCEVVIVGIDGGGLDDLFGLTVLGREIVEMEITVAAEVATEDGEASKVAPRTVTKKQKRWLSWSHAWCHKGVLERRQTIASTLRDFERAGDLTIVDDELEDLSQIVAIIERVKNAGLLHCVALDPAGVGELVDALAEIDVTQDNKENGQDFVAGVPQGYALMNAIKTSERKLANGTLIHCAQPLMAWAVANLKIEATPTAIRATKQNAGDAKVDPAFALFDAAAMMSLNPSALGGFTKDYQLPVWG